MTVKDTPVFEHTTCSRCSGTGSHSFNLLHGSVCYGCGGSGYKLTKRGRAANDFLKELRSVQVQDVKVGDLLFWDFHFSRFFARVTEIAPDTLNNPGTGVLLTCVSPKGETCSMGALLTSKVRRGFTAVEKAAQIEKALAYQAKLTKDGKLKKGEVA